MDFESKKSPLPSSTLFSIVSLWHIRRWHCNQKVLARQYLDKPLSRWQQIGVVQHHQLSLRFSNGAPLKGGGCDNQDKSRTTLRENVRIGLGLRRKKVLAEERSGAESRSARAVNSWPDRLPSPNLCPDGSAERKSFAPQKKWIKDMPINVLFTLSPTSPTSAPPSGCLLMLSSLSFPTQLVWRAPP